MDWSPFLNIGYICKSKVLYDTSHDITTCNRSGCQIFNPRWMKRQSALQWVGGASRTAVNTVVHQLLSNNSRIKLNWKILIRTELDLQTNVICVWYCLWIQVIPRGWLQVSGHWNTKCAGRPCWSAEQKVAAPPTLQIATFKSWHFFAFGFIRLSEGKTLENP